MAFTEFCCRSGGSNLNSGTRTGNSTEPGTGYDFEYLHGTWVQSTRTFTRLDAGDFTVDAIAVNDFVSIYPDAATVSPYVARIDTVTATTIITSATAKMGTAPVDGTANTTARVGGAWKGPNAASGFPFTLMAVTLTNAAGDYPRVNFKNDANFAITAAVTGANAGPTIYQGYTTSYGDLGKATIDGTIVGASYVLLTHAQALIGLRDLIFQNNGTTGSATGLVFSGAQGFICRVVVNNVRGIGLNYGNHAEIIEIEVYKANQSNTANLAGITTNDRGNMIVKRAIIHDCDAGTNCHGVYASSQNVRMEDCIIESNAGVGVKMEGTAQLYLGNCDIYNNALDGVLFASGSSSAVLFLENSNFIKNGGYGINENTTGALLGLIRNCGFGAGTQVNTSGQVSSSLGSGVIIEGSVTYPDDVTPWVDPADGDFRISLAQAKQAGRGAFTQTQSGYGDPNPTVAYNDIGAARHVDPAAGGGLLTPNPMRGNVV